MEYYKARTHNNVYMKRFATGLTSKSMVTKAGYLLLMLISW